MEENDCVVLYVPRNMTDYFQMLDLNVNGHPEEFLKQKSEEWYTGEAKKQLDKGKDIYNVDVLMKLSNMKPKDAQWVIILYDHLRNNLGNDYEIVGNGRTSTRFYVGTSI